MNADSVRAKFLGYFKKQEHIVVPSSSLVPDNDTTVLLTTAGMQQFKPYFLGEEDPEKKFGSRRLASSQRVFRTSDIDEVGDGTHLTFFEMLGNFSISDYSKDGAIRMAWECLTKTFKVQKQNLWATVFAGDDKASKDIEAIKLWQEYIPTDQISENGRDDNWWGPPGKTGPCGPCSELHYDFVGAPCERGKLCRPNCPCGRFMELWNLVFMEYSQREDGTTAALASKNVDTGMGLERLMRVLQSGKTIFDTDLFKSIIAVIEGEKSIGSNSVAAERVKKIRIIADHLKGTMFLLSDGVRFSNKDQGYILRRIFRRALDQFDFPMTSFPAVLEAIIALYKKSYPQLERQRDELLALCTSEADHFVNMVSKTIEKVASRSGAQQRSGTGSKTLTADEVFTLYSTHGTPLERLKREGFIFDEAAVEKKIEEHKKTSRAGVHGKFGGHGLGYAINAGAYRKEDVEMITRLHTATHLLHKALRTVLGDQVRQNGSDITPERLRFDFTYPSKLSDEQRARVEALVNEQVQRDLPVTFVEMPLSEALRSGALSFFREKYPDRVTVYSVGDFSKEICGGPHVHRSGEVGTFRIISEKSSAAGIRRIKAVIK